MQTESPVPPQTKVRVCTSSSSLMGISLGCNPNCSRIVDRLRMRVGWEDPYFGLLRTVTIRPLDASISPRDIMEKWKTDGLVPASPDVFLAFAHMLVSGDNADMRRSFFGFREDRPIVCVPEIRMSGVGSIRLVCYRRADTNRYSQRSIHLTYKEASLDIPGKLYHALMMERF